MRSTGALLRAALTVSSAALREERDWLLSVGRVDATVDPSASDLWAHLLAFGYHGRRVAIGATSQPLPTWTPRQFMSPASNSLTEERYDDVVYLPRRKERLLWRALLRVATEVLADWSYRHYTTAGTDGVKSLLRGTPRRRHSESGPATAQANLGTGEVGGAAAVLRRRRTPPSAVHDPGRGRLARSTKHGSV